MAKRRASKKLKEQLARPTIELSWGWRVFLWAFGSETSCVLSIAILFIFFYGLQMLLAASSSDLRTVLLGSFALMIFGVFLGIVIITEDEAAYKSSGLRIRVTCGLIAGMSIALMGNLGSEGVVVAGLTGATLGYFGICWVKYC